VGGDAGRRPAPGEEARWQSLVDSYLADPSTANLWRMYDAIETATTGEDATPLAARWSLRKYQAVQLASHMLLHRTLDVPDWYHGAPTGDPVARRQLAIARNPFWRVGDSVRQNPLNCNQPDPCTTFPPALDATINPATPPGSARATRRRWPGSGWASPLTRPWW
jgi:hypothetical protein